MLLLFFLSWQFFVFCVFFKWGAFLQQRLFGRPFQLCHLTVVLLSGAL